MNVFSFTGNLGKDAEQRFTQSGESVVSFSVAVKSGFGKNESTSWIKCNLWGKRGESVAPYLSKGQLVGISGEFSAREWEDKDGTKRISNEVRVDHLDLLGGKQDNKPSGQTEHGRAKADGYAPPPKPASKVSFDDLGDDIPFNKVAHANHQKNMF